ncbi:MAG: 4-alpha-glucanotransferase [Desulfobacterales bacterium]|nr:4-alpha-glucanotransferase [Desulfobacterales bacterium]
MQRGSGILFHFTSLPDPYGIGSLGKQAHWFLDFLQAGGQQYWQFLPITPTSPIFDNSPYMSLSAFAGNPLLIDPQGLVVSGLLDKTDLAVPEFSEYLVDFPRVIALKTKLLGRAFAAFRIDPDPAFVDFRQSRTWLADYALFMSLREENNFAPWYRWPGPEARRRPEALDRARDRLAERILYYQFEQFVFNRQWQSLRRAAQEKKITLIGDIPIYTALDSVDVWTHQEFYKLDRQTLTPTHVAGVPPDYFSSTGQRWGNPVYCWHDDQGRINHALVNWWQERFNHIFSGMDMVRIDHFRGLESYWEIPAAEKTAIKGRWVPGPGLAFFEALDLKKMSIIAEDLGVITPEVEELRDALGLPGMKILQFAFDSDMSNPYLPHNYKTGNCVVYTGTHDNDTSLGWYLGDKCSARAGAALRRYANSNGNDIARDMVRIALASVADLAIIPLQDLLGFGSDCRMNTPSTMKNNWRWRCAPRFLNNQLSARLQDDTGFYNRLPDKTGNTDQPTGSNTPDQEPW